MYSIHTLYMKFDINVWVCDTYMYIYMPNISKGVKYYLLKKESYVTSQLQYNQMNKMLLWFILF